MSPSQVTAGLGLLRKVLPDLTSTAVTGGDGGPVQIISKDQRDAAVLAFARADR